MAGYSSKERARGMLRDAIISLCREAIPHKEEIAVDGLLGITVDQKEVFLVTIQEMIGGGQVKKKRNSDLTLGLTVKSVEGNSNAFFYETGSDQEGEGNSIARLRRKRKSDTVGSFSLSKHSLSADMQKNNTNGSKNTGSVNILGETVQIKQEKPDSDEEKSDDEDDAANWQLCVDQGTSNDEALVSEVLEMSGEQLRNFAATRSGYPYAKRASQARFHDFSEECGTHRPHLIPPTARRSHPQKRCRVCYRNGQRKESRYCCPVCPGYPGLCVVPCFDLFHTDKSYQSASNLGYGMTFDEIDSNADIAKALGLSRKMNMVVKMDSLGKHVIVPSQDDEPVIETEYVGPDEEEQFYTNLEIGKEDDDQSQNSDDLNQTSDTEEDKGEQDCQTVDAMAEAKEEDGVNKNKVTNKESTEVIREIEAEELQEQLVGGTLEEVQADINQALQIQEAMNDNPAEDEQLPAEGTQYEAINESQAMEILPEKTEGQASGAISSANLNTVMDVIKRKGLNMEIIQRTKMANPPVKTVVKDGNVIVPTAASPRRLKSIIPQNVTPLARFLRPNDRVAKVVNLSTNSQTPTASIATGTTTTTGYKIIKSSEILSPKPKVITLPQGLSATKTISDLTTQSVGGTKVITLSPSSFSDNKGMLRLPAESANTKTFMITKTPSGEIKKTPIILKTLGKVSVSQSAAGTKSVTTTAQGRPVTTNLVSSSATSLLTGKTVELTRESESNLIAKSISDSSD